jgi:hypothetical protein
MRMGFDEEVEKRDHNNNNNNNEDDISIEIPIE